MRWVLRVIVGSAQISSRVLSGPMPARLSAAATLTLAGKPRAPSRALPSNTFNGSLRPFSEMPRSTRYGAPSSPFGGLRVIMVTEWMVPSAAARTASRPSRAPVGTRMRAPVAFARSTKSQFSRSWPTESGMNSLPRSITEDATARNNAGGKHSTTRSQGCAKSSAATTGMRVPTPGRLRFALSTSRTDTAASTSPGMPVSMRRATSSPTAPSPAKPILNGLRATLLPALAAPTSARYKVSRRQPRLAQQGRRRSPADDTNCRNAMTSKTPRSFMTNINPNTFTTRPEIEGTFGVVTSTHWIATAVGMGILERGGNAFDAAVATAFTLQVVEPHLNGPGGDVPVIIYDTRRGKPEVICGQGPAPAGATISHYRNLGLDLVPGTGLLAACVPGTFETWMLLLRDYGSVSLRD